MSSTSISTALSGYQLLNDPLLNKGTAFSEAERDAFDLHGLLPPHVTTLDLQVERRLEAFRAIDGDLRKYIFLRGLQDTNETLFYALLIRNIEEMMPIVYTPTVGRGCQDREQGTPHFRPHVSCRRSRIGRAVSREARPARESLAGPDRIENGLVPRRHGCRQASTGRGPGKSVIRRGSGKCG